MIVVRCARAIAGGKERLDFAFAVDGDRIAAAGPAEEIVRRFAGAQTQSYGRDVIVTPGFVNGHSHAYQILMRGWADDLPFERWRSDALYRVVPQLSPDDVYWTFRLAFDEMLAAGITTVVEFFYLNGAGNAHAERAIEAAHDAGIRLIFARTWMDAPSAPPQFRETIDLAAERTRALMEAYPGAKVCVAPHSLHAASPDMIRAAAEFARDRDCMMHVHVAEQKQPGSSPIDALAALDALNERTVAVHAIHISDAEKRAIAQAGARVVHNPMTNQYLGDGICDVAVLQKLGIAVALGTDADVKPSLIDEMRAASLLQKLHALDAGAFDARTAFDLGTAQGARALRIDVGDLRAGAFADFVVLDASGIDEWNDAVNALVYRAQDAWVRETHVGGRLVRLRGSAEPHGARDAVHALVPLLKMK
jgi:5-methylthioadenosine/S-adenosylhomocysteine deaminase